MRYYEQGATNYELSEILEMNDIVAEATSAYKHGKYLTAAKGYFRAAQAYALSGDGLKAAEMANNCSVSYLQGGEPELALEVIDGIEDIFKQSGAQRHLAMTIGNRGAAFDALNKVEEAINNYRLSADLFNQLGEDNLYITTIQAISALQLRKGRSREALATMQIGIKNIKNPNLQQRLLKKLLEIPLKMPNH